MTEIRGLKVPFRIDPRTGGLSEAAGPEKIRQNIRMILGTRIGERPMLSQFGARLHSLVQEPNDAVLETALLRQLREALAAWEPRVVVTRATVTQKDGEAALQLDYALSDEAISDTLLVPLG
jgi:phage baseplate assembly protein W